jgi:hypothetical protein
MPWVKTLLLGINAGWGSDTGTINATMRCTGQGSVVAKYCLVGFKAFNLHL